VACHKFDDAMTFYRRVLELDPGNASARDYLEKLENHREVDSGAEDPQALYNDAQQLAASGDYSAAIKKLEALVEKSPEEAVAHNDLGVLFSKTGRGERAVRHYERAYRLQPENITFTKNLAEFYYAEQGRIEEALQIYVDILAKNPEDVETLLMTGRICDSLQRFGDARVFYERVLEIEPWNQDAGELLKKSNRAASTPAIPGTDSSPATYQKAQDLASEGRCQEAVAVLETLIGDEPDDALAHNDLGVLYLQTGQPDRARQHYERACELAPENTTFRKNLADYYWVQMGRMEDALKAYVEILESLPEDIETLMSLGNVCTALQRYDDARVFFERVLEIEPWNAEAGDKLAELDRLGPLAQTG
jgi:Flp pilus assembly protein TadD